jgi:sulfonate transport system substrate-binding protein
MMTELSSNGRVGAAVLAIVLALCAVGAAAAQEAPPKVIRLAGPGNAEGKPFGTGTLGVLKVKALLEDEFKTDGVSIQWQFPRGTGPAINEAFANQQLDFASYGGLPNIVGRGAGLRTKVLSTYGISPTYVVARNGSGIETIADLRGKRVSASRGTILQLSLGSILERQGLTERDIQLFDLITADQISAVQSGDIDAVVGTASVLSLVERGFGKIVFSTKGRIDPASNFQRGLRPKISAGDPAGLGSLPARRPFRLLGGKPQRTLRDMGACRTIARRGRERLRRRFAARPREPAAR